METDNMLKLIIVILIISIFLILKTNLRLRKVSKELEISNGELDENRKNLQLILNSTAEAIYGFDKDGNCNFCNVSGLKMLGYENQDELLGKNMHTYIHHSYKDGTPMALDECKIFKALNWKKGIYVNDEVFWRKDGTSFDVEYHSFPQIKDNKVIGAVVTFVDITEKKRTEEEIRYLSYHDSLTGLYNRMFFDEELKRIDTQRNLPISIIHADANGLKLTNDIFGHRAGDTLLILVANVLKKVCRVDDIIARIGGDEFIVLLPKTDFFEAEGIMKRIKNELSKEQVHTIKAGISMGICTKINSEQDIYSIIEDAEVRMYQEKTLSRKNYNTNQITNIIKILHEKYPREELHSKNVSELSKKIGIAMNLSVEEVRRLEEAGYLHDIGKIVLDESIINKSNLTEPEEKEYKQHSVAGYRILNSFDDTLDLAEAILSHHEYWDGSGFPKGLKGMEIPKLARILSVAEHFDGMTNRMNTQIRSIEYAIEEIKSQSGVKFDPKIVQAFIEIMKAPFTV